MASAGDSAPMAAQSANNENVNQNGRPIRGEAECGGGEKPPAEAEGAAEAPQQGPQAKRQQRRKLCLADFGVGRQLGKGKFGFVHLAKEKKSGKLLALKIMWKEDLEKENYVPQVKREVEIHSRIHHPNVVRLYAYFSDLQRIYLVLEYVPNGNVSTEMNKHPAGRLPEPRASRIMRELISAIAVCHKHGVVHRDIKPENILVAADGSIKLADFGWSVAEKFQAENTKRLTYCGTLDYLPPEIANEEQYDERVDVWMAGCVAAEILVGLAPFYNEDCSATKRNISKVAFELPPDVSEQARAFVDLFLVRDPNGRVFPIKMALFHPWISHYSTQEERDSLLQVNQKAKSRRSSSGAPQ